MGDRPRLCAVSGQWEAARRVSRRPRPVRWGSLRWIAVLEGKDQAYAVWRGRGEAAIRAEMERRVVRRLAVGAVA